ncbi:MAG: hypothetical protein V1790_16265 [Planctomycetota bacterium]
MSRTQIPMWAIMASERKNKSGSIPDLPDEELADPEELEWQLFVQEWGPILALPVRGGRTFSPDIDEDGGINWGAFGTVDFERTVGQFDKVRYKIDKLREERRDAKIMIDTVRYRVRDPNKYVVLRYALRSVIDIEDVLDEELKGLVRLYLKVRRLTKEIEQLQEARRRRKQRELAAMLARWE